VKGTSREDLLDTYHAERHPVGARVLHNTIAQVALTISDERHRALHDTMVELLAMDEPRKPTAPRASPDAGRSRATASTPPGSASAPVSRANPSRGWSSPRGPR
jgi:hypothetical protein